MKKLLSLLGAFALTGTAAISVVACGEKEVGKNNSNYQFPAWPKTVDEAKELIKNHSKKSTEIYLEVMNNENINNETQMMMELFSKNQRIEDNLVWIFSAYLKNFLAPESLSVEIYDLNEKDEMVLISKEFDEEQFGNLNFSFDEIERQYIFMTTSNESEFPEGTNLEIIKQYSNNLSATMEYILENTKMTKLSSLVEKKELGQIQGTTGTGNDFEIVLPKILELNSKLKQFEDQINSNKIYSINGSEEKYVNLDLNISTNYIGYALFTYLTDEGTTE